MEKAGYYGEGTLRAGNHPLLDALSLDWTRSGAKLENTSLSTNVSRRSCKG